MNHGRIVDAGAPEEILVNSREEYTRELVDAIHRLGQRWTELDHLGTVGLKR